MKFVSEAAPNDKPHKKEKGHKKGTETPKNGPTAQDVANGKPGIRVSTCVQDIKLSVKCSQVDWCKLVKEV